MHTAAATTPGLSTGNPEWNNEFVEGTVTAHFEGFAAAQELKAVLREVL
jgi:hypothetical protein